MPTTTAPARKVRPLATGTRERLILEAEALFGERGIDGVTMRMICEAANQKFAGSVQYHFGDQLGLLYAVFEYREEQLQPQREALLKAGRKTGQLDNLRYLLRILFEPNFAMYEEKGVISYMRCHAAYLATHRPRGVPHPVDQGSPATRALREAMTLLEARLAALGPQLAAFRLECVGAMFLQGVTQYASSPEHSGMTARQFYDDMLDMMTQAISVLPRTPPSPSASPGS
ncbi:MULTISPECIES: TetR/AcrR family transcriptional regulator [Novosphingobium]|uniref:TetR/AcrR family transcriptional regulator n=1 Tax=Novosphingobium TaxID=165696 RepID=UPI000786BB47|nr:MULTISPECIES: TetR/AcrR family transcriptional regulator [Novosphingobium]PTR10432.1 TetR family transcriptional regulator [Novosphingobium sp. GV055]PUB03103.1 TetR family transcriptional regulator [Novosphingobium sp. GV061]PUB19764.1 TetR family transcriptional regulator [Novosphingobium sp. GV079]PUB41403.1 TetR family transcriptional regulator [Novosphingobium sp. GV027]WQD94177.1 TetR/AcrR family transcriptional regulator [Novosphingobium capsulatum]